MRQRIPPNQRNEWGQVVPPFPYTLKTPMLPAIPAPAEPLALHLGAPKIAMPSPTENTLAKTEQRSGAQPSPSRTTLPEQQTADNAEGVGAPELNLSPARRGNSGPEIVAHPAVSIREAPAARARHIRARRRKRKHAPKESFQEHHQRHCAVCNHPDREFIDDEFLHWHDPRYIGMDYRVGWRSVYRHAHAMGLFAQRDANLRFALGGIIQQCHSAQPSADSVIRAVRAYGRVTTTGEWVDPPHRVVVSYEARHEEPARVSEVPDARQPSLASPSLGDPALCHTTIDLEPAPGGADVAAEVAADAAADALYLTIRTR